MPSVLCAVGLGWASEVPGIATGMTLDPRWNTSGGSGQANKFFAKSEAEYNKVRCGGKEFI